MGSSLSRFFGFLRAGKFTCPSQSACPSEMLIIEDVAIDSHEVPSYNNDNPLEAFEDWPIWSSLHVALGTYRR